MLAEDEPWRTIWLVVSGAVLCAALVWGGLEWRGIQGPAMGDQVLGAVQAPLSDMRPTLHHPFVELAKLVAAALIGIVVTGFHRRYHGEKPLPKSLQQAQMLLCVAGAMIMVIIGNNLARAFGVAGAAGIVRFRTPVEDPKDTTVIFLLLGLGMACGLGAFAVAGLGMVFLCSLLAVLDRFGETRRRTVVLSLTAPTRDFPTEHVHQVLSASVDFFEQREVVQGSETLMRYQVTMDPNTSLTYLTQELLRAGLKSVSWGEPGDKKRDKVA